MAARALSIAITRIVGLLCGLVMGAAAPAQAERLTRAGLVHCGADSCLRLSGYRARPSVAVQIGGRDLDVEGGRAWLVTVPLSTARTWPISRGYSVAVTLVDSEAGTERTETVVLPPGSLGSRLELTSLIVRAY